MTAPTLLIRADASVSTGTGHAMRCLALAQAWQDAGGRAVFAMAETTAAIQQRLHAESCETIVLASPVEECADARETIKSAQTLDANWVVVDGYRFNAEYQKLLKAAGCRVLFLDDFGHAKQYAADVVLNQNVGVDKARYAERQAYTQLLLGPRYALLRREFSAWCDWKREIRPIGKRLLIIMGGSDPQNLTARVIEALRLVNLAGLSTTVVVGGSNPYFGELQEAVRRAGVSIELQRDVSKMAELMAAADIAVSAAGSTCWELCMLGLPSLLFDVADNQVAVARKLHDLGCAVHLGKAHDFNATVLADQLQSLLRSEERRRVMSDRCRALVDGQGTKRVASILQSGLRLRLVRESDCDLLGKWANDPQVRANSFSTDLIPLEEHNAWFAARMADPNCLMLIAENYDGAAVGQLRVDWRSHQDGEIDVSVAPEFRGAGYGSVLIELGVSNALATRGQRLHARVKKSNEASQRAFEKAGFAKLGSETVHGEETVHYVRGRDLQ